MVVRGFGSGGLDAATRSHELAALGHLIDVRIGRAQAVAENPTGPVTCDARGLIDTGASDVCIDFRMAMHLGLQKIDEQNVGVVGGSLRAAVYLGTLEVPELNFKQMMPLYALKVARPTHDVLLGRSFLKNFIVTFDGPEGRFHFAEPPSYSPQAPFEDE